ncbi:MAG TPA: hypothetical protein VK841_07400 [Polyangiaceae bacterium]|nr:hypothetical protein [Polyangiaceae bacterium]
MGPLYESPFSAASYPLSEGSAALGAAAALCFCQHDAQRHSMMKVPSWDALRVTRQPYDELIRVCDVFVGGATAAHPKHLCRSSFIAL